MAWRKHRIDYTWLHGFTVTVIIAASHIYHLENHTEVIPWREVIKYLTTCNMLETKSISHFYFLPAAPHILLQYCMTSTILHSIEKGSISVILLLHNCYAYHLFNLYNQCYKMTTSLLQSLAKQQLSDLCHKFFNICPTKKIPFHLQLNNILSHNKTKQFYFCF